MKSFARVANKGGNIGKALYLVTVLPILFAIDFMVSSFEQMMAHKRFSKVTAGVLAFAMVFTSIGISAVYAAMNESESQEETIVSFEALAEETAVQELEIGAYEDDIDFPDTLNVTVERTVLDDEEIEDGDEEEVDDEIASDETDEITEDDSEDISAEEPEQEEENEQATEAEETPAEEIPAAEEAVVPEEPEIPVTEDVIPAEETPAEAPAEPESPAEPEAPEAPAEAAPAPEGDGTASILDLLFPAITVKAAEIGEEEVAEEAVTAEEPEEAVATEESLDINTDKDEGIVIEEVLLSGITWRIVPERSTAAAFDSSIGGAVYVYVPVIPGDYNVKTSLPTITVTIEEEMAFEQSIVVDGVKITVKADKGVFPEGATVVARRATAEEETIADAAVATEREAVNIASSYTFDITVYDKKGNEIQPDTAKGRVKVLFELAEASDSKLDAEVYHITNENPATPEAEKLATENYSNTLEVETTGFSMYTVEFTYNGLLFVMDGDTELYLSDVLAELGIYGEITYAKSSNEELFKAFYIRDNWKIAALQAFSSYELLTVIVDGKTYEIDVTDSQYQVNNGSFVVDTDNDKSASTLVSMVLSDGISAQNANRKGAVYTFANGMTDLGINAGIILDTSDAASDEKDSDLEALIHSLGDEYSYGGHTSALEFEMTATGNLLNFNYVFASKEFNQDSSYNDAFGLFVSINGGAYENIALITKDNGSKVPVSIVNLRAGSSGNEMDGGMSTNLESGNHSLFRVSNITVQDYVNGISNVFNAQKAVNVGDKVKIKFVICDCGDTTYDSLVFIEAGSLSFDAPNSQVNYATEELKGLDAGAEYEITCEGVVYNFTSSTEGTIPLSGTDKNNTEYNFIGKNVSIVKKGETEDEDSQAQNVVISGRPNPVDVDSAGHDMEIDANRPADVGNDAIVSSENSITLKIDPSDETKMNQQYCIFDENGNEIQGQTWVEPDANGQVVFNGLTKDTTYTIKARIKATSSAPASYPSTGIKATTIGTLQVTIPDDEDLDIQYDGTPRTYGVTVDDKDAEITYSTDKNTNYTSEKPTFTEPGVYTVYYKVTKPGARTVYGSYKVTIKKTQNENETSTDTVKSETVLEETTSETVLEETTSNQTPTLPTIFVADTLEEKEVKKDTVIDPVDDLSLLGKGNIVDNGDIWSEISETTKVKLLDKLDEKGGEIIRVDETLTLQTENADKIMVKNKPIALVMGEGAIVVTMEVTDEEKTSASLADANAVAKSLLTEEQLAQVAAGSVFEIKVEVTPIEQEAVPELDAQVISDGVAEYAESNPNMAMADYIDISMYFRVDDADWEQITETEAFDIVIDIPDRYKGLGSAYYIMRAHNGKSTLLSDLDDNDDTITISTGQFSTYALMYDEIIVPETIEKEDSSLGTVWMIAMLSLFFFFIILFYKRRKEEEEENVR